MTTGRSVAAADGDHGANDASSTAKVEAWRSEARLRVMGVLPRGDVISFAGGIHRVTSRCSQHAGVKTHRPLPSQPVVTREQGIVHTRRPRRRSFKTHRFSCAPNVTF